MQCPFCGRSVNDGATFCSGCGERIPRCQTCGAPIRRGMGSCDRDGTPVPEDVSALFRSAVAQPDSKRLEKADGAESVDAGKRAEESSAVSQNSADRIPQNNKRKRELVWLIVLVAVAAAILAAVVVAVVLRSGSDREEDPIQSVTDEIAETGDSDIATKNELTEEIIACLELDENLVELEAGSGVLLTVWVDPPETKLRWVSNDPSVATVDADGYVTAVSAGICFITVFDDDDARLYRRCEVVVSQPEEEEEKTEEKAYEEGWQPENETEDATLAEADRLILEFIFASDQGYFTEADLWEFDADMCRKARNGIYARHGRMFQDEELQAYFEQFDWYVPSVEPEDFSEDVLNACETENIALIREYEAAHGYNQ